MLPTIFFENGRVGRGSAQTIFVDQPLEFTAGDQASSYVFEPDRLTIALHRPQWVCCSYESSRGHCSPFCLPDSLTRFLRRVMSGSNGSRREHAAYEGPAKQSRPRFAL